MRPRRVAFFSFFLIFHFPIIAEKDIDFSQAIINEIDKISGKDVRIKTGPAKVYRDPDQNSKVIGKAKKGSQYRLLKEGEVWCKITFKKNQDGWIRRNIVNIVDTPPPAPLIYKSPVIYTAIILFTGILIWFAYFIFTKKNRLRTEWFSTNQTKKKILIVSKKETQVKRHLTNTTTSMEKCFMETGFEVQTAKDSLAASELIFQYRPDAIVVDWQLNDNIQSEIENILSSKSTTRNMFVLFYNVSNSSGFKKSTIILNTHYLGNLFNDRDLFNIITPLIITGEKKQSITKSIETSALQGNVADGGVSEVFQFVEIGNKTGCLLIEDIKPSGIVYFKDGIIIYATTKNNKGQKAVFEILNFNKGQFIFVLDKKPKVPNCSIPTLGILMEWTRIGDENTRNRLRKT